MKHPKGAESAREYRDRCRFGVAMSQAMSAFLGGKATAEETAVKLEAGAKWLRGLAPTPKPRPASKPVQFDRETACAVRTIYDHWVAVSKLPDAQLTPKRQSIIAARLAEGATAEQLKAIATWAAADPHYSGANDRDKRYDNPETMYRSRERVEDLLERSGWTDRQPGVTSVPWELERLREERRDAIRQGDIERANDLLGRIESCMGAGIGEDGGAARNEHLRLVSGGD